MKSAFSVKWKKTLHSINKDIKIGWEGGEVMETTQLSGGTMLLLGIIIAIVIVLIPAFIYIYAWIAAILLIIGGIVSILTGGG